MSKPEAQEQALRCIRCDRYLRHVAARTDRGPVGPTCAVVMGLIKPKAQLFTRRRARAARPSPQLELGL